MPTTLTFVVTGGAATVLWPFLGPYALIAFGAVVGSLLAMSRTPTPTRWDGVKFVGIGVFVAMAITGPCVWVIEKWTNFPGHVVLMPVAFFIAAMRGRLLPLMDRLFDLVEWGVEAALKKRTGK